VNEPVFVEMAILSGWLLWTLLAVAGVALFVSVVNEHGPTTTFFVIGTTAVLTLGGFTTVPQWLWHHPLETAGLGILYLVCGIPVMILKWWLFCQDQAEDLVKTVAKETVVGFIEKKRGSADPSSHKDDLAYWMAYWPFCLVSIILDEPVRRFFRLVYNFFGNLLRRISIKTLEKAHADR